MSYQFRRIGKNDWNDYPLGECPSPMVSGFEYRIKPEPDEPKWPQTTMTYQQLREAYLCAASVIGWDESAAMSLANAAIAHACEYGALVPADKVRELEKVAYANGMISQKQMIEEVDRARGHYDNWVGCHNGLTFSQSQMEIQRKQQADAMARGLTK